jgi:hypothetical protein
MTHAAHGRQWYRLAGPMAAGTLLDALRLARREKVTAVGGLSIAHMWLRGGTTSCCQDGADAAAWRQARGRPTWPKVLAFAAEREIEAGIARALVRLRANQPA